MGVFANEIARIQGLDRVVLNTLKEVLIRFEDELIEFNVEEQLFKKGEDSAGRKIKPKYKRFTIRAKIKKGQPTDRVTLRDRGDYHASFRLLVGPNSVRIITRDINDLKGKYGDDIEGVQFKNLKIFLTRHFIPLLKIRMNDQLTKP